MRVIHFSKNLAVSMFCIASCFQLQAQQTPLSEIFFLDLGIVIEPSNGNNKFSRTVDRFSLGGRSLRGFQYGQIGVPHL
jgi:hypothetical protein